MKYDSGTGWPSFFTIIPGAFGTSTDYKLILPRTEYHCALQRPLRAHFRRCPGANLAALVQPWRRAEDHPQGRQGMR